ncbi:hypothetical protein [Methanosarcina mazei]|nr:hypothetical protein [Methanosarcina mazei]
MSYKLKELFCLMFPSSRNSTGILRTTAGICLPGALIGKRLPELWKSTGKEFLTEKKLAKIHYSVAERAISDYSNASGDFVGTLDLMLTYVEEGVQFARIFGVIGDEFYDSIEGMLDRLCEQLKTKEGQKYYPLFRERLLKAGTGLENIGWGFEDAICILVADIEE